MQKLYAAKPSDSRQLPFGAQLIEELFMSIHSRFRLTALLVLASASLAMLGCAGTPPKAKFSQPMATTSRIGAADTVDVTIEAAENVTLLPAGRDRVGQKIKTQIDKRKVNNHASGEARTMQVVLYVTRYEKGNAFARAMLAGLGQIHLDGSISVYQMPDHTLLEKFDLQKTFAWGGIYGSATSMEDIEDTFADGVAATVTGQDQPSTSPNATAPVAKSTTH
jgi:hypothetical protein